MQLAAAAIFAAVASMAFGGLGAQAQPTGQPGEPPAALQAVVPGEEFLPADVRAKQQDDAGNPAFPFVQAGEAAWSKTEGSRGKACKDCHGMPPEPRVTAAVASYPSYARDAKRILTLPARINFCRKNGLRAPELAEGSEQMMAMTAYLRWTVRGRPPAADVSGPAEALFAKGKELYFKNIGENQNSCADCHNRDFGHKFGGETLRQGHAVAYPVFSLAGKRMISLHERFRMCNGLARAEPQAEGSADYVALELYLNWRSKDLPMTAPGVRP